MSVVMVRSLWCDFGQGYCENWFGQQPEPGAHELRQEAKRHGWTRGPYGKGDRCPAHPVSGDKREP